MAYPTVARHWVPRLRALPSGARPNPKFVVLCSQGSLVWRDMRESSAAIRGLRAAGVAAIPACATISASYGHTFASWFDRRLWTEMAEQLARLAELRDGDDPRIAIDLESYLPREPRYPQRGSVGNAPDEDEYRLAIALEPLIGMIKHLGVTPWILPGGMQYAPSWHLATACPDAVLLDEMTYQCPLNPAAWVHYELRQPALTALRRGYLPGFYGVALRDVAFQRELQRRQITDYWVYFREKEDDPQAFWSSTWLRNDPDNTAP